MRIENYIGQHDWKAMPQKIDLIDKKIAFLLCKNSRLSNTAIAKALKLKREVVAYRIKKMQEQDFLHGFITRINPRKMGFLINFVYLKLKTPVNEKELIEELVKMEEVTNLKNEGGKFDTFIEVTCKNIEEFDLFLRNLLNKHGKNIQDYSILQVIKEECLDLDFMIEDNKKELERLKNINESKGSSFHKELTGRKEISSGADYDEIDRKILNLLLMNSRINLKDISSQAGCSLPSVEKRIKKLVSERVITAFTAYISLAKLGYQMYPVLFNMSNVDENKLFTFTRMHPHILWTYKLVGNWNYQFNIFAKNNAHFHDTLNDLREAFSENIVSFDPLMVFSSFKAKQRVE